MKILKLIGGTTVVLGSLVIAAWLLIPDPCGNSLLAEYPSPDQERRLVVLQRDCGATTGFSTQASLIRGGAVLTNEAGNVFVSDDNHGAAPSGPGGGPQLGVSWESPTIVQLSYHPATRVFKSVAKLDGVSIRYVVDQDAAQQTVAADRREDAAPAER
jgi:hypothetical protein